MAELIDPYGRKIEYLRLSVTDRCDLRCNYCMPVGFSDYETPADWLSFEEIERVIRAFAKLGLSNLRITGGEPLLRKNLTNLVSSLSQIVGLTDISLSTNGTRLSKYADELKAAGLRRVNVSLDSLDAAEFSKISGRDVLSQVLTGLESAKKAGFNPIKINAVYTPTTTIETVETLIEYAIENQFVLRLIEVMPVGDTGRSIGTSSLQNLRRYCEFKYNLVETIERGPGPAKYLVSPESSFKIGFITPMSQHFCETCNRVRLSVDGTIYLCLGQDNKFELRPLLRSGISDIELINAITHAISLKPERHEFTEQPDKIIRIMARTGG